MRRPPATKRGGHWRTGRSGCGASEQTVSDGSWPGEQPGSMARGITLGGGVMYQQDGLALGVAYGQRKDADGRNTTRNYSVGGSYA